MGCLDVSLGDNHLVSFHSGIASIICFESLNLVASFIHSSLVLFDYVIVHIMAQQFVPNYIVQGCTIAITRYGDMKFQGPGQEAFLYA